MALHELPLDVSVLHGHFSRDLEPVLVVDPGDSVRVSVPNAEWRVGRDEPFEPPNPELDTGHALAGPVAVRGARTGETLVVECELGLSRADALGLASVVVDLRVTQVVNEVLGVHAVLRDDALR